LPGYSYPRLFKNLGVLPRKRDEWRCPEQGCQMVYFQTKNSNFGKFWRALDWKVLVYFMTIWNILRAFGIFHDHSVHLMFIWYIFSSFGIMYPEKSGNPGPA
jgi:hypothetical protein